MEINDLRFNFDVCGKYQPDHVNVRFDHLDDQRRQIRDNRADLAPHLPRGFAVDPKEFIGEYANQSRYCNAYYQHIPCEPPAQSHPECKK
jgi:hypothetical protein